MGSEKEQSSWDQDGIIFFVEAKWNRVGLKWLEGGFCQGSVDYIKRVSELRDAVGEDLAGEIIAKTKQFKSLVARVDSNGVVTMKHLDDRGFVDKTLPPFE